jgi:hypothetical protein
VALEAACGHARGLVERPLRVGQAHHLGASRLAQPANGG